jgi:ArsR family transcriptional regulator, arsenate/arsenite/antimonite-responsive transcriptional repressor
MESIKAVAALAALAQETRLAIFRLLVEAGPTGQSVGEIGADLKAAPATLSFHLKELTHAGLIVARQDGRYIFYSANFEHMKDLLGFLTENCCAGDGMSCDAKSKGGCSTTRSTPTATRDSAKAGDGRGKRPTKVRA